MDRLERLKEFFKVDVSNSIPAMVKEHAETSDCFTDNEVDELLKENALRHITETDNTFCCVFMDEPYVKIYIDNDVYRINVEEQNNTIVNFIAHDFDVFKQFWNTDIVSYFGQAAKFPEINF